MRHPLEGAVSSSWARGAGQGDPTHNQGPHFVTL